MGEAGGNGGSVFGQENGRVIVSLWKVEKIGRRT